MASSFISYKEKGLWVNDRISEFFAREMVQILETESNPLPYWLMLEKDNFLQFLK